MMTCTTPQKQFRRADTEYFKLERPGEGYPHSFDVASPSAVEAGYQITGIPISESTVLKVTSVQAKNKWDDFVRAKVS